VGSIINRLPSTPRKALASFNIPPGYLNDFNVDDIDFESIDFQSESPESILNRVRDKVFSSNKFKTSGTLIGVLMRTDKDFSEHCTSLEIAAGSGQAPKSRKYALNTYKIRIPELHFMLPVPNSVTTPDKQDKIIMDSYPTIQAADTSVNNQPMLPGDLVKVEIANKGAISRLYCTGPLDPKATGMSRYDKEKCYADCLAEFTQGGSVGDCAGQGENLAKLNSGIPPISTGGLVSLHNEIRGPYNKPAENWLAKIIKGLQANNKYKGVVWLGPMGDGSDNDDLERVQPAKGGRQMLIYVPVGVNLKSRIEIIYWFHNSADFADNNSPKTLWTGLQEPLSTMLKKAGNKDVRNFVLVVPEMLWSRGKDYKSGQTKRVQAKINLKPFESKRYRDRHWGAWGFDGKIKNDLSVKPSDGTPVAMSATNTSPAGAAVGGDISKLHTKVLKVLEEINGSATVSNPWITLVGDRYGSAALGVLARKSSSGFDVFDGKPPNKIQYFHGGYSGTPLNAYCDNDLYHIINSIGSSVALEVHLGDPKTNELDGTPASFVPRRAAAAFFGSLNSASKLGTEFNEALQSVNNTISKAGFESTGVNIKENEDDIMNEYAAANAAHGELKKLYDKGLGFISGGKTVRMSGPWKNIVFKKWNDTNTYKWLTWLSVPGEVPTAFSIETAEDELNSNPTKPGTQTCKTPAAYDKDGKAYDKDGNPLPACNLKSTEDLCPKGSLKNHTPKPIPPEQVAACEKACGIVGASEKAHDGKFFNQADAHPIENLIMGVPAPNFKSNDRKRDPSKITTIVMHQSCVPSRSGTIRTLNGGNKGNLWLGTHFTIDKSGKIQQHVDPERSTAHAGSKFNSKSIGIDILTWCKYGETKSSGLKDRDAAWAAGTDAQSKFAKKYGVAAINQLIKTGLGWKGMQVVGNLTMFEKTYQLVKALVAKYPSLQFKFPGATPGGYLFDQGPGNTGIVAHGHVSGARSDGRYITLYMHLRHSGKGQFKSYANVLRMAWHSGGYDSVSQGNESTGKSPKKVRKVPWSAGTGPNPL